MDVAIRAPSRELDVKHLYAEDGKVKVVRNDLTFFFSPVFSFLRYLGSFSGIFFSLPDVCSVNWGSIYVILDPR